MNKFAKIKVLVVDNSLTFRKFLIKSLETDSQLVVIATAADPFEARDKIMAFDPDVMTLDVDMPRMNGIEFLRRLMPQYPLPTVMVSGAGNAAIEAISLGAMDFICKPPFDNSNQVETFVRELVGKVKIAAAAKHHLSYSDAKVMLPAGHKTAGYSFTDHIIAIGASTGGTVALTKLLTQLRPPLPGVAIVQHIPPEFSAMFAKRLASETQFAVKEAVDGDSLNVDQVLVAPGDKHMRIKRRSSGYYVECFTGTLVNGHCPSVDVLFDSAAAFGSKALGIILTGMGRDGARGLLKMRRAGAFTIGQDEASSVVYGMPKVAHEIGAVVWQGTLDKIAAKIREVV